MNCKICNKELTVFQARKKYIFCSRTCSDFSRRGQKLSDETRKKISNAITGKNNPFFGKKHSEETKAKMRSIIKSDEWKKHMSESGIGVKLSPEHKKNISNGLRGRKHSEETKRKMSISHMGEKSYLYGKHLSDERKQRLSELNKNRLGEKNPFYGKKHSLETRQRISKKPNYTLQLLSCKNKF